MKKKFFSMLLVMIMCCSFINIPDVSARSLSAAEMKERLAVLKSKYPTGWYWADGWCNNYETGDCGPGYNNAAWECMGFAYKICNELFEEDPRMKFYQHNNINNLCVGDYVRISGNVEHSIVVTNISGNTVYYVDCNGRNGYGYNVVCWERSISKSNLANRLVHIKTQVNNWVKTLDNVSAPTPTPTKTPVSTPKPVASIHQDNNAHVRNGFFTFKNVSSGKMMQINSGADVNKQPVDMWTYDGSKDQRFNVVHKGGGKYKIYAECSGSGTNRVIDIFRNNAAPAEGQLVDLYDPNDDTAQLFYIWPVSDSEYVFELASKQGYVICPKNSSAANQNGYNNGSQLILQKYTGASHQKWKLCNNNGKSTTPSISYANGAYKVDTEGDGLNMRSSASTNGSIVQTVPDGAVLTVTQVSGNWGYASYNGKGGWVCLDFTSYTVVLSSISVASQPTKMSYYAGDVFDCSGMTISANYSNGQKETIGYGFSVDCDLSTGGTKTATVKYKNKTAAFSVNVKSVSVSGLTIKNKPSKIKYHTGDKVDPNGLVLLASYNNGTQKEISSGYTINSDLSTAGTKTVTVNYGGKAVTYDVTVENSGYASIGITTAGTAYSGDEVTANVILNDAKSVYDGNFNVVYDNAVLKLESYNICSALSASSVQVNTEYGENKARVTFAGTSEVNTGTMVSFVFKVISDNKETAALEISDANMYNVSGNSLDTTVQNTNITIKKSDYTINSIYLMNEDNEYLDRVDGLDKFYAGIRFNKNSADMQRPTIVFAIYDENDNLADIKIAENRYSQGEGLECEVMFNTLGNYTPSYIAAFIFDDFENIKPMCGKFVREDI